jgi:hypothetical protein
MILFILPSTVCFRRRNPIAAPRLAIDTVYEFAVTMTLARASSSVLDRPLADSTLSVGYKLFLEIPVVGCCVALMLSDK